MLETLALLGRFKEMERFTNQVFWRDYQRKQFESNADHTWRMCLLFLMVADKLKVSFDTLKVIKMILIHDVPEILAGDTSPLGEEGFGNSAEAKTQKRLDETKAAQELFAAFDDPIGKEFFDLWLEYEAKETNEAKICKALDRLEGKIQVLEYLKVEPGIYKEHKKFSATYGVDFFAIDPTIQALGQEVIKRINSLQDLD